MNRSRPLRLAIGIGLLATASLASPPIFMKYDGIDGDITAARLERSIPPGASGPGSLKIIRQYDKSSPVLMKACATGSHAPRVELRGDLGAAGNIVLENVMITSYTLVNRGGPPTETLSLNYTKITFEQVKAAPR